MRSLTTVLTGSTLAPHVATAEQDTQWLRNAFTRTPDGFEYSWFAALETVAAFDVEVYQPVRQLLKALGGEAWTFSLDTNDETLTSANRLTRICTGRNLVTEYAVRAGVDWLLYLDADVRPDADAIPKLVEVAERFDHPIVGGDVPSYCLSGPKVEGMGEVGYDIEEHMNTAGFLLVARSLFTQLRWRHDPDQGLTDDPCYHQDALRLTGKATWVRKDVVGEHVPLVPLEARGRDRRLR